MYIDPKTKKYLHSAKTMNVMWGQDKIVEDDRKGENHNHQN